MHRRALLRTVGLMMIGLPVSGCLSSGEPEASPTSTPTSTTECIPVELPVPTPTDEGLKPKMYPPYPDTLTKESAVAFAKDFERTYRYNEFLADWFIKGTDAVLIDVSVQYAESGGRNFVIGVDGIVQTEDTRTPTGETPRQGTKTRTAVPLADIPFASWYLLTDHRARRYDLGREEELSENPTPPNSSVLSNAPSIKCR